MESDILAVVKPFQFKTHVLEEESVFLRINFESTFQQPQNEFHFAHGNDPSLVDVDDVPGVLEVADIGV